MAFEILDSSPSRGGIPRALDIGECSLTKAGEATLRLDSLALAGIDEKQTRVTILIDKGSLRIALRKLRKGEEATAAKLSPTTGKGADAAKCSRRRLDLKKALRELSIDEMKAAGRYELLAQNDLVILAMMNPKVV